ncbi:MAG: phosphatase PAP2 family protein [Mycetocola sp.]
MTPSRVAHPIILFRRVAALPPWIRRVDSSAGRRINTRHVPRVLDRRIAGLSRSADHGVLWFAAAAVLVVASRYRPAIRGVASLMVASVITNLVGKNIVGGERPLLSDVPVRRHLKSRPESGSFPSGHSASAAAFATGVALESPRIGAAVAPVAGAVAYSRLHTGAHWLSDVVGGIAIGVGVAVIGKILVPADRRRPHREGGTPCSVVSSPTGDGVFLVRNPSSGAAVVGRQDPVPIIERRLPDARTHVLDEGEDVVAVVRSALAAEPRPRILGVCGGDGMVATLAQLAREADLPLVVIPGGTFNHFARTAGIDGVDDAIDALVAGEGLIVDVAELRLGTGDPVTVTNAASVGVYPDVVAAREKLQPVLGKWIAGVVAAVSVLATANPVDLELDGRQIRAWSLFVGINRNYPFVPAPMQRRRLDDGVLDIRILHAKSRVQAIAALSFGRRSSVILARLGILPTSAVESFTAPHVVATVHPRDEQEIAFAHDGEIELDAGRMPDGSARAEVTIKAKALTLYAPRR